MCSPNNQMDVEKKIKDLDDMDLNDIHRSVEDEIMFSKFKEKQKNEN